MRNKINKLNIYLRMIKFEHSLFAFPFALAALILAGWEKPVTFSMVFWIIMAVVWARSAAMGFNRLVDAKWDAKNPRTALREIPKGTISLQETGLFVMVSGALFILSAAMLSFLCFLLSFPVLFLLFFYSYTKRFTPLSHLVLGLVQSLGPLGVWVAVTGSLSWKIVPLALAVGTYIAGFDLLYALQDVSFDRQEGLHSIPADFGITPALALSAVLHGITFISLLVLPYLFPLSNFYRFLVFIIGILLLIEHLIVKPQDLSKIEIAFFYVNSIVSVLLFTAMAIEEMIR